MLKNDPALTSVQYHLKCERQNQSPNWLLQKLLISRLLDLWADCVQLRHGRLQCTFMLVLAGIPLHHLHCDATQPFPFNSSLADATMLTPECAAVITTLPNYILCVFMCRGHGVHV